ncbi:MAG: helix-turn-helix transcriptional regulator [Ardenticatenaceae bacterium]|nr:helix-turn-helix transcriptional regulator [Ardenticatenaceae bacterium]MCB9443981.1 helix-turn-helix transcriptional regulator [Ardenticatenaceae bacterium]
MDKKLLLLGLLRTGSMHGYQLNDFIESTLATCVQIKRPTAYYVLNKMQDDGWVEETEEQEGNRPPRRIYTITPSGEAAFQELLRQNLAGFEMAQFTGDVGLAFLDVLSPAESLALLQQRRMIIQSFLEETLAIPQHPGSLQLTIEHQMRHLTAELDWLDEIMARLEVT